MAWEAIQRARPGGGGHAVDYAIRIAAHQGNKLAVTIAAPLMRKLRWKIGDRVHFLIDRERGLIGLQRTTDFHGITITLMGGKSSSGGRVKHGLVKLALPAEVTKRCVNGQPRRIDDADVIIDDAEDIVAVGMLVQ